MVGGDRTPISVGALGVGFDLRDDAAGAIVRPIRGRNDHPSLRGNPLGELPRRSPTCHLPRGRRTRPASSRRHRERTPPSPVWCRGTPRRSPPRTEDRNPRPRSRRLPSQRPRARRTTGAGWLRTAPPPPPTRFRISTLTQRCADTPPAGQSPSDLPGVRKPANRCGPRRPRTPQLAQQLGFRWPAHQHSPCRFTTPRTLPDAALVRSGYPRVERPRSAPGYERRAARPGNVTGPRSSRTARE